LLVLLQASISRMGRRVSVFLFPMDFVNIVTADILRHTFASYWFLFPMDFVSIVTG